MGNRSKHSCRKSDSLESCYFWTKELADSESNFDFTNYHQLTPISLSTFNQKEMIRIHRLILDLTSHFNIKIF